jgi:hypothetical protein
MPVPFHLGELGARLQRGRARPLHLLPCTLAPDLFGAWIRTAAADYPCYEQQTSPLHQAHIAARLAASVLPGQQHGVPLGPGTLPAAGPELAELILGPGARNPVTRLDTGTLAFLALERARRCPQAGPAAGHQHAFAAATAPTAACCPARGRRRG